MPSPSGSNADQASNADAERRPHGARHVRRLPHGPLLSPARRVHHAHGRQSLGRSHPARDRQGRRESLGVGQLGALAVGRVRPRRVGRQARPPPGSGGVPPQPPPPPPSPPPPPPPT